MTETYQVWVERLRDERVAVLDAMTPDEAAALARHGPPPPIPELWRQARNFGPFGGEEMEDVIDEAVRRMEREQAGIARDKALMEKQAAEAPAELARLGRERARKAKAAFEARRLERERQSVPSFTREDWEAAGEPDVITPMKDGEPIGLPVKFAYPEGASSNERWDFYRTKREALESGFDGGDDEYEPFHQAHRAVIKRIRKRVGEVNAVLKRVGGGEPVPGSEDKPRAGSPGIFKAPVRNGSISFRLPSEWTGRGRPQVPGGAHRKAGWTGIDMPTAPRDDNVWITVSWQERPAGTVVLPLEWQPIAGDDWQRSDGGPVGRTSLVIDDA